MKTDIFKPVPKAQIFTNARTRYYYKGDEKIWLDTLICDKTIFNPLKAEKVNIEAAPEAATVSESNNGDNEERAARRAKNKVFELCLCNEDLKYFATFTLNSEKIDRKDYSIVIKKLNSWLDYRVRNIGLKFNYN